METALATADAATAREADLKAAFEGELQDARSSLDAALAEDARLGAQLEAGAAEKGTLLAALSAAQNELQTANEQRDAIASQLKASSARIQTLERSQAKHDDMVRQLQAKLDVAKDAGKRVREQPAGGDQKSAGVRAENAMLRGELDRFLRGKRGRRRFRGPDAAASAGDDSVPAFAIDVHHGDPQAARRGQCRLVHARATCLVGSSASGVGGRSINAR